MAAVVPERQRKAYFGNDGKPMQQTFHGLIVNEGSRHGENGSATNAGLDVNFLEHFNATLHLYQVNTHDILGQRIASVKRQLSAAHCPAPTTAK